MFNTVTLVGRPTREPQVSTTSKGTAVCRFTLAVDRDYQGADGKRPTDFWPVTIFGPYGEKVATHLTKGRLVLVHGSVHIDQSKDEGGAYHTFPFVTCSRVQFLDRPVGGADDAQDAQAE